MEYVGSTPPQRLRVPYAVEWYCDITDAVEWDGLEDFVDNPMICIIIDAV